MYLDGSAVKNRMEGETPPILNKGDAVTTPMRYVCPITGQVFEDSEEFQKHLKKFQKVEPNQVVKTLALQPYIPGPPKSKDELQKTYSASDEITVKTWWDEWVRNKVSNFKNYKPLENQTMLDYGKWAYKPCIIAGSGPSLKKNAHHLKDREGIGLVSTLHNFGFFEEQGITADYYLNLDAGDITISEAAEGFKDIYEAMKPLSQFNKIAYLDSINFWERTKDKTLVTALHCNPELHKRWQGRVLWFDTALKGINEEVAKQATEMNDWNLIYQTGGNTLGACLYHARAILGASPIAFIGADFSFKDKKFHSWDSPYDAQCQGTIPCIDIYGQKQETWPSYYGFKTWFEFIACGGLGNTPHSMVNCTEGGILGAFPEGNIMQIRQRSLLEFLREYNLHKVMPKILTEDKMMALF